jgi:hypothetical protein
MTDEPRQDIDRRGTAPPVGEEIHLPGGSLQPLLLCVGVTLLLVGITSSIILVVIGGVLALCTTAVWIRDARREFHHLPSEHHH